MRKPGCFDYSRRTLLGASGALTLLAALRPLRIFAQASGGKLRIGIIGSGHIGGVIGGAWVKAGHPVLFSSRHPEELKDLAARLGPLAQNGTVSQAVAFGDALFFAVPYARCHNSVETTVVCFKAKSYSTPAMPYQRATELSPTRWSAKVLV